jgi:hypothetical protein
MPPPTPWEQWLLDLLCQTFKSWGGDCDNLSTSPSQRTAEVIAEYNTNGTPTFNTPEEKQEFLAVLTALEAHLDLQDNTLSQADTDALKDLIENLRNDLIP